MAMIARAVGPGGNALSAWAVGPGGKIAVAGFAEKDLNIEVRDGVLTVAGKVEQTDKPTYLHQGIAGRGRPVDHGLLLPPGPRERSIHTRRHVSSLKSQYATAMGDGEIQRPQRFRLFRAGSAAGGCSESDSGQAGWGAGQTRLAG